MKCPRCGFEQPESPECVRCGVVFRKLAERAERDRIAALSATIGTQADPSNQAARQRPPQGPGESGIHARSEPGDTRRSPQPRSAADVYTRVRTLMLGASGQQISVPRRVLTAAWPPYFARRQFYNAMQRMLRSGAGLELALASLGDHGFGRLKTMAREALQGVRSGESLSQALSKTGFLPPLHVGFIAAGESLGTLPDMFDLLTRETESHIDFRNKAIKSSIYPSLVLLMSVFIMPVPTLVLGSGSAYASEVMAGIGRILVGAGIGFGLLRALPPLLALGLRYLPGAVERFLYPGRRAQALWVLHSAMRSGVGWQASLEMASRCFESRANLAMFEQALESLAKGGTLADAIRPLVDPRYRVLLTSGEVSGNLEEVFRELHVEYQAKSSRRLGVYAAIASVLLVVGMLAYVAGQTFDGLSHAFDIPAEQLEMLNNELKGTGLKLF